LSWKKKIKLRNIDLKFKAGISHGLVYAGKSGGKTRCELTCHGDVVNYAARLAFSGDWGNIVTSEAVERSADNYACFDYGGEKKFKGKDKKLPYYFFKKIKDSNISRKYLLPLIGRDNELKEIYTSFEKARNSFEGIFYIYGEPGIGKSRLIYGLKEYLDDKAIDYNWIEIICDSMISKPRQGLKHYFRNYFGIDESINKSEVDNFKEKIKEIVGNKKIDKDIRDEIWRTHSFIASEIGIYIKNSLYEKLEPKYRKDNLFSAIKSFIKGVSQIAPTVIEIVDSQWIDPSTDEFISYLTRNVSKYSFVIFTSSRYLKDNKKKKFEVGEACPEKEIELMALKPGVEKLFSKEILGKGKLSINSLEFLIQRAHGIPSYIEQWLLHLKNEKAINLKNNFWILNKENIDIPGGIDKIIIARIDSLGVKVKEIIQHASILGSIFPKKLLNQFIENNFKDSLKKTLNSGLLLCCERDNIQFAHSLIQDVAYQMQLESKRERLHNKAIELIEKKYKNNIESQYNDLCFHTKNANNLEKYKYYLNLSADFDNKNYENKQSLIKYLILEKLTSDNKKLIDLYTSIGSLYHRIGPLINAEKYYLKAKKIITKKNNSKYGKILNQLSTVRCELGKFDYVEKDTKKALEIYKKFRDESEIISGYNYLGNVYKDLYKFKLAEKVYLKSIALCGNNFDYQKAIGLSNLQHILKQY